MPQIGLNNINNDCKPRVITGIDEVYFARRSHFGKWKYEQTSVLQTGKIIGNTSSSEPFLYIFKPDSIQFTENQQSRGGRSYEQSLSMSLQKLESYNRDKLEQLKVLRDVIVFFIDSNNRVWLAGETNGLRVSNYNATTDNSEYSINLSNTERSPIREVDRDYFDSLITCEALETTLCETPWDVLCNTNWCSLCETIWQDSIFIGNWDASVNLDAYVFRTLTLSGGGEIEVFWGDGTSDVYPTGIDAFPIVPHTYPSPDVYEITVKSTNLADLFTFDKFVVFGDTYVGANDMNFFGVIDLRLMKELTTFGYMFRTSFTPNAQVTEFLFDSNNTQPWKRFEMQDAISIEKIDVSNLQTLGNEFLLTRSGSGRPGMTGLNEIIFPSSMSVNADPFSTLSIQGAPFETNNHLDMSGLQNAGGSITVFQCWRATSEIGSKVTLPHTTSLANNTTSVSLFDCRVQTVDFTGMNNLGGEIIGYGRSNNNFNTILWPTSLRAGTEDITTIAFTSIGGGTTANVTNDQDFSALTTINNCRIDYRNGGNVSNITFPPTAGSLTEFDFKGHDLGYNAGITNFATSDGIVVDLSDNGMTTTEVNFWLRDFDNSGWTGGTLNIAGSNAAPDTTSGGVNGVAAVSSLTGKSWTVITS